MPTPVPTSVPTLPPTTPPSSSPTRKPTEAPTFSEEHYYEIMATSYQPLWYSRSEGWQGQTYLEALQFCATQNSRVPCPYLAYCPVGTANHPLGGYKPGVAWAPIIDAPNAWVQV